MLLKEVMQKSGLTRKQIEILQQKGLIHPTREENGYRNYTEQDLKMLKQINFLKKFEFTLNECQRPVDRRRRSRNWIKNGNSCCPNATGWIPRCSIWIISRIPIPSRSSWNRWNKR